MVLKHYYATAQNWIFSIGIIDPDWMGYAYFRGVLVPK